MDAARLFITTHPILAIVLGAIYGAFINDLHSVLKFNDWSGFQAFDYKVALFNYFKAGLSAFLGTVAVAATGFVALAWWLR